MATDSNESCALEIHRSVCQFFETPPDERDATVYFDRAFLLKWIFGQTTFDDAVAAGDITIDGEVATVSNFLAKFEPFNQTEEIAIAAR